VKVVGVTLGVNSIVCRVDSTGGVHFRSKRDCLKPGEEKNADHLSEAQNNRCDIDKGAGGNMLTVILPTLGFALAIRGHF
jgi:hypothetical protein